ncbi:MAG: cyclophilin-like fold protein [Dehalococcoidia bacterium]
MSKKIKISSENFHTTATLNNTKWADYLYKNLPIEGSSQFWGDELFFSTPINMEEDADSLEVVNIGDIAFWPPGSAFCIFWGPTPMSRDEEIRPVSKVNLLGSIDSQLLKIKDINAGNKMVISRFED